MSKQNYHHGDLKSELINTGLKLLDQDGYEAFSLRKVAKACNVSQTAPYRHFKDKDELISAIAIELMQKFDVELNKAIENNPDNPKTQLIEMGIAYIHFFVENPEYLRLLFLSDIKNKLNNNGMVEELKKSSIPDPFLTFYHTVECFQSSSTNSGLTEEEQALYSWGLVHGISILLATHDFPFKGDYMDLVRKILYHNVR